MKVNKPPMILLHGLFGQLSNWDGVAAAFSSTHDIHIPLLPIYDTPRHDPLHYLVNYLERYINSRQLPAPVLVGNSLGGHVAILYAARHPLQVQNWYSPVARDFTKTPI